MSLGRLGRLTVALVTTGAIAACSQPAPLVPAWMLAGTKPGLADHPG
jgi:hypothetical protein